jgi:hypothetical protein
MGLSDDSLIDDSTHEEAMLAVESGWDGHKNLL